MNHTGNRYVDDVFSSVQCQQDFLQYSRENSENA